MRLKYQLFIALLVASALLVALMFTVSSLSFSRGFLSYINSGEEQRVQTLVAELEQQYATDGSWNNTSNNPRLFLSLLRSSEGRRSRPGNPPRESKSELNQKRASKHNKDLKKKPHPPPPLKRLQERLILANENKEVLIGQINTTSKIAWHPITNKETVVGYIGINKLKKLHNKHDRAFEQQQRKSFAVAGLAMVLLSALLAAPLASRIVKPILKVKRTVAELSDGNFNDRINTSRRDEIGDLSSDINKLGATLESNKNSRQRHFAEISHELRTPVGVLQAELEALQDGIRPLDQSAVDSLHAETLRLSHLIEDLQTLSQADAGALDYQMQPVDIKKCVYAQIERHRQTNPDLSIQIHSPDDELLVNGDPQRLQQLLDNLFQNTARYTNLPGKLEITLSTDNSNISLVWKDSAPGVSTDALDKLFDPLFRTEHSRNRAHGGSGLGLSIVRKIVDAHHGTCNAQHSELGGLKITITLPAAGLV